MGKNTIKKIFIASAALIGLSVMSFDDATAQTFKDLAVKQEQKMEQQVQFDMSHAEKLANLAAANLHGTVTIPEYEKPIQTPEALKRYENISVAEQMDEFVTAKTTADFSGYNQFDMLEIVKTQSLSIAADISNKMEALQENMMKLSKESLIELSLITGIDYRNSILPYDTTPPEHLKIYQKIMEAKANLIERNMDHPQMQQLAEFIHLNTAIADLYINTAMLNNGVKEDIKISRQLEKRFEDTVGMSMDEVQQLSATSHIRYESGINQNEPVYIANYTPDEDDNVLRM